LRLHDAGIDRVRRGASAMSTSGASAKLPAPIARASGKYHQAATISAICGVEASQYAIKDEIAWTTRFGTCRVRA
jgi:hypothetical protein